MQRIDPEDLNPDGGVCPVCEIGPKMWTASECKYCGWQEDDSEDSPERSSRPTGANGRWSLNAFKAEYRRRKDLNPKYVWAKHRFMKKYQIDWTMPENEKVGEKCKD